jgi:hypothetical protein
MYTHKFLTTLGQNECPIDLVEFSIILQTVKEMSTVDDMCVPLASTAKEEYVFY